MSGLVKVLASSTVMAWTTSNINGHIDVFRYNKGNTIERGVGDKTLNAFSNRLVANASLVVLRLTAFVPDPSI